jgi:hypothetical protein
MGQNVFFNQHLNFELFVWVNKKVLLPIIKKAEWWLARLNSAEVTKFAPGVN